VIGSPPSPPLTGPLAMEHSRFVDHEKGAFKHKERLYSSCVTICLLWR